MVMAAAVTEPQCKTNLTSAHHYSVKEFDYISVNCEAIFRGRWTPVIDCQPQGRVVTHNVTDNGLTYKQVVYASPLVHGQTISCTLSSQSSSASSSSAETPSGIYTWRSPIIRVISE